MIPQPVSSISLCFPLPSGTWRTPGLSIPWCCRPTSSSVCLVFFPLSLCLARWFWSDLMNGRHDHTTAVCVSLRWWGLRVVSFCLVANLKHFFVCSTTHCRWILLEKRHLLGLRLIPVGFRVHVKRYWFLLFFSLLLFSPEAPSFGGRRKEKGFSIVGVHQLSKCHPGHHWGIFF